MCIWHLICSLDERCLSTSDLDVKGTHLLLATFFQFCFQINLPHVSLLVRRAQTQARHIATFMSSKSRVVNVIDKENIVPDVSRLMTIISSD